jgi:chemotaxis protein methyltransferase CheR
MERVLTPRPGVPTTPAAVAPEAGRGREFAYAEPDFVRVRKLIHAHAGIALAESKRDLVYSRLARRLRATGCDRFEAYLDALESGALDGEWEHFVNALTTNLTAFFREQHHFGLLEGHLRKVARRPIRIWCSAASTGEEPYSIAMTVVEAFDSFQPPVSIVASDLDTRVLETGALGIYPEERVRQLPRARLSRFFLRGNGSRAGLVRVRPELQRLITFQQINLLDPTWAVDGPLDVLFCRNVMIYFDKPTQHRILARFAPLMQRDGLLFAGHSESFVHAKDLFRPLGKTVYAPV